MEKPNEHRHRFDAYIGFVSPPASFEYSAQQFLDVCAGSVGVIQHLTHYPDAAYGMQVHDGARRLEALRDGIAGLRDAGATIIAQFGGYWSLPYAPNIERARQLEWELSQEFGVTVILNWTAIADALHSIDAKRISVTTGYYRPDWSAATVNFLESAGFELLWSGDIADQGIVDGHAGKVAIETATGWDYPDHIVKQTCIDAAHRAPECDAVLQTGAGMRTTYSVAAIESATEKTLIATDLSMFWAVMKAAGVPAKDNCGALLGSL